MFVYAFPPTYSGTFDAGIFEPIVAGQVASMGHWGRHRWMFASSHESHRPEIAVSGSLSLHLHACGVASMYFTPVTHLSLNYLYRMNVAQRRRTPLSTGEEWRDRVCRYENYTAMRHTCLIRYTIQVGSE